MKVNLQPHADPRFAAVTPEQLQVKATSPLTRVLAPAAVLQGGVQSNTVQPPVTLPGGMPHSDTSPAATLHVDARLHLQQLLQRDPTLARPRELLFALELGQQRFEVAEKLVTQLLRERPDKPDYLAMHSDLLLRTAELTKSREVSNRALALEPEHVEAQRVKAMLDLVLEEHPGSDNELARLLARHPESEPVLLSLFGLLVERQQTEAATRLGREMLRAQPHNEAVRSRLLELQLFAHPWSLPLNALRRFGWSGSAVLMLLALAAYRALSSFNPTLGFVYATGALTFGVYACVYPALMRRWIAAQLS